MDMEHENDIGRVYIIVTWYKLYFIDLSFEGPNVLRGYIVFFINIWILIFLSRLAICC
jgi:hypothetical protein